MSSICMDRMDSCKFSNTACGMSDLPCRMCHVIGDCSWHPAADGEGLSMKIFISFLLYSKVHTSQIQMSTQSVNSIRQLIRCNCSHSDPCTLAIQAAHSIIHIRCIRKYNRLLYSIILNILEILLQLLSGSLVILGVHFAFIHAFSWSCNKVIRSFRHRRCIVNIGLEDLVLVEVI